MSTDWNGKAEPFKIHPEGWGAIIVLVVILMGIVAIVTSI